MSAVQCVAGPELDALVATNVMGWRDYDPEYRGVSGRWFVPSAIDPRDGKRRELRAYSTDIAAAWAVVAHMRDAHNYLLKLEQFLMNSDEYEDWYATFEHRETCEEFRTPSALFSQISAPLAICLAALKAVEAESPTVAPYAAGGMGDA